MILILIRTVLLLLLLAVAACGGGSRATDRPSVVAGLFPLAQAAESVAGGRLEVTNLTPVGAEPHDVELSPDQVDLLLDADLIIYVGAGFQPAVEEVARGQADLTLDVLSAASSAEGPREDPHVWLDPLAMGDAVTAIERALSRIDPGGADAYSEGAGGFRERLVDLHERFADGLARCERRKIVVSHAAFGHLAARYRLEQVPISGLSPEVEPSPSRLNDLVELVQREDVTTVFSERLASREVATTLAREAGVGTAVLDPIEGLNEDQERGGEDYFSLMEQNLAALRKALACR